MATYTARAVAVLDALVNGTSTATQRQRVLDAYLYQVQKANPAATNADAAAALIADLRGLVLSRLKDNEARAAAAATYAQVDADFPDAP